MESVMTERFWVFPYAQGSEGAKLLAEELGCKRILREGSTFSKKAEDVVINWGASDCPVKYDALNKNIKGILNKKLFFDRLKGTGLTPKFETDKLEAADNLKFPIFCRTKLEGKDGEGIVIAEKFSQLVPAKLYTEYEDKTSEYRIHIGRGPTGAVIIGAQKKVTKTTPDGPNISPDSRIMTGDGVGLVWTVNGQAAHIPQQVLDVVKKAFEKFPELDFCAFDIIYNNSSGKAFALEANSAPMGTTETMKRYAKFFKSLYPNATGAATPASTGATAAPTASASVSAPATSSSAGSPAIPIITVEQVTAAQQIINAYIQQHG
jgi:hypothetical protein